jgi:hypothetical protein
MKSQLCAGLLALAALAGCAGGKPEAATPVASPSFSIDRPRAALGSPVEVSYRFVVAQNAPAFEENYRVLVHFLDSDQEMMWTDDHEPAVPTKAWKPGQTVEYARTMFIPIYPYIGEASVQIGLYSLKDGSRLPLSGADSGQRAYKVGTIQLLPQSENVFLIYKDGWHRAEVAPENATVEWQWTKKDATIAFRNPKRDSLFYLQLDGRTEPFSEPQRVAVRIGDQQVDAFEITSTEPLIRKIPLTAAQLGPADIVDLKIEVDKTFVPALLPASTNRDPRELGVRVFHAFVEPR